MPAETGEIAEDRKHAWVSFGSCGELILTFCAYRCEYSLHDGDRCGRAARVAWVNRLRRNPGSARVGWGEVTNPNTLAAAQPGNRSKRSLG